MELFGKLPLNDRSFAIDLMQRQIVEAKRNKLAIRAGQAFRNYKQGRIKRGTVADLKKALEND
jgi:hypothetical protein